MNLFEWKNNVWLFVGVLFACFAVSSGVRFWQLETWKCHQRMTLNLIVPFGMVRFVFYSSEHSNEPRVDDIGVENYARLTIPPGIWFGFQGKATGSSLIMNVANIVHDPEEVLHKPVSDFFYDWNHG